jgi:hypothetical protein
MSKRLSIPAPPAAAGAPTVTAPPPDEIGISLTPPAGVKMSPRI